LAEAEADQRAALALRRKVLGEEHPDVTASLNHLGVVLWESGRLDEAKTVLEEAATKRRKLLGADDLEVATIEANLARVLCDQGRWGEAEPWAQESLSIRQAKLPDDWRTFNSRSLLGGALLGQKKYAEAEPLLVAAYQGMAERRERMPADSIPRLKEAGERLTQLYEATGRPEQAVEWKKRLAGSGLLQPPTNPPPAAASPGKTNTTGRAP
jgi:tetratricopeptide (TPR) repeat protein